jgi:hypothetical protein
LIFSKVNEGLFRRYREADPSLAKIIRNIKDAVKADARLRLERHGAGAWIVVEPAEVSSQPIAPVEVLESYLVAQVTGRTSSHELVGAFVAFVQLHPHYSNGYPITGFAQALRGAYVRAGEATLEGDEEEAPLRSEEVETAIEQVAQQVQAQMHASYVGKGKVCNATFDHYFKTIRDLLVSQYASRGPYLASQFDALQAYIPSLTREAYGQSHRNILEYLIKRTREQLLAHLRYEV